MLNTDVVPTNVMFHALRDFCAVQAVEVREELAEFGDFTHTVTDEMKIQLGFMVCNGLMTREGANQLLDKAARYAEFDLE